MAQFVIEIFAPIGRLLYCRKNQKECCTVGKTMGRVLYCRKKYCSVSILEKQQLETPSRTTYILSNNTNKKKKEKKERKKNKVRPSRQIGGGVGGGGGAKILEKGVAQFVIETFAPLSTMIINPAFSGRTVFGHCACAEVGCKPRPFLPQESLAHLFVIFSPLLLIFPGDAR
ncbi:hypothetical protein CEXT_559671 [Caerostris extrusa]|uniref:Uncharacterized protein n=1 Tax=Caerostris extrusa TaxID=172846 RepID=A0AAV4Q3K2_CAEEX|nr:hypothetical protein CEXT_559671 [Caerostris extrusa]